MNNLFVRQVGQKPYQILAPEAEHSGAADAFLSSLPNRPWCTDDYSTGLAVRPKPRAARHRYVQYNHPSYIQWMLFDIDYPGAFYGARDANLPAPQIICENPQNGHAHIAYRLAFSQSSSSKSRKNSRRKKASRKEAGSGFGRSADR